MANSANRDRILIGVVVLLVLLLLIPVRKKKETSPEAQDVDSIETQNSTQEKPEPIPAMQAIIGSSPIGKAKAAAQAIEQRYDRMEKIAANPERMLKEANAHPESIGSGIQSNLSMMGENHPLLPLIPGSYWEYEVSGDNSIIPHSKWTMRVLTAPKAGVPGLLEIGFGDSLGKVPIVRIGNALRVDWLPFVEPLNYLNNRPSAVSGVFLGDPAQIIKNSVWSQSYTRQVLYQYQAEGNKSYRHVALAKQHDRATVGPLQKIVALTSAHDAYVIEWSSLIEIRVGGRVVLNKMTTEPYRKEKMWIVPQIGIVRREIHYGSGEDAQVVFDLVGYHKPEKSSDPAEQ